MKKLLYAVRDDLGEVFMSPFCSINDSTAKRDFIDGVSKQANKNDLTLYYIGEYNDNSGILTPILAPKRIMSGLEMNSDGTATSINDDDNQTSLAEESS